jgi:hypothetical protein
VVIGPLNADWPKSNTSAKNGFFVGSLLSPVPLVKFARYDGRTMLWPKR